VTAPILLFDLPANEAGLGLPPESAAPPELVCEPLVLASRPLIPLGDSARRLPAPVSQLTIGSDWVLNVPPARPNEGIASAEATLDVYVHLISEFARAGNHLKNSLTLNVAELSRRRGWTAPGGHAAGSHYRQAMRALDYLSDVTIDSAEVRNELLRITGGDSAGQPLRIVERWTRPTGPTAPGQAVELEVHLTSEFTALLSGALDDARYSDSLYASLPRGVTRSLYRYLSAVRQVAGEPQITMKAQTVLSHLGCRRLGLEPSRIKTILEEPHLHLYAANALGKVPNWTRSPDGDLLVTYMLEPQTDLAELLEESSLAFGVTPTSAVAWSRDRTEALAEVLASAVLGIITPTHGIGPMTNNYLNSGRLIDPCKLPHFAPGRSITVPEKRHVDFDYLLEQFHATEAWLATRPRLREALRRRYAEGRRESVVEGLVMLAARRMRGAESLATWRERNGLAAPVPQRRRASRR
jgi:hypothetical protein